MTFNEWKEKYCFEITPQGDYLLGRIGFVLPVAASGEAALFLKARIENLILTLRGYIDQMEKDAIEIASD